MTLALDPDDLAKCVACGLCLPHCPTFRVTGDESASPRGRIAAMRLVESGTPVTAEFVGFMDLCVQCRGCEAACPSAVPFGRLMEQTRHALTGLDAMPPGDDGGGRRWRGRYQPWWRRAGFAVLGHPRALRTLSVAVALAQRLRLVPKRLGLPRIGFIRTPLEPTGSDLWLFTGCVMDAWMRPVHAATKRVIEATDAGVTPSPRAAACCGALAAHAGLVDLARSQAAAVVAAMPGSSPVVVDSAGCGAYMKDYGRLLGPAGDAFGARVVDVHEWLVSRVAVHPLPTVGHRLDVRVAVQDPCHLRHVQKAHGAVREALEPYVSQLVETADDGLCCGAGGSYAVWQPDMATAIRDRKLAALAEVHPDVVVSANPGCAMHLGAAGLPVRHPMEVLDEALRRDGAYERKDRAGG